MSYKQGELQHIISTAQAGDYNESALCEWVCALAAELMRVQAAQPQGWRRVEVELPEIPEGKNNSKQVLAVDSCGFLWLLKYWSNGTWNSIVGMRAKITHWMPLPPAPEVKS